MRVFYVSVNMAPLAAVPRNRGALFIPKKYQHKESGRLLKFREIINMGADRWWHGERFTESGIEVVENTSEEVLSVVVELNARIDGTWEPQAEDEELQDRYRSLFPSDHPITECPSRVGAEFLRQNRKLLE